MIALRPAPRTRIGVALLAGVAVLALAGCETTGGGTAPLGIGTAGGAVAGAGVARAVFGSSPSGMLIGAAAGGLAGNMTLDRRAEDRRRQEREASADAAAQRQLDLERQRGQQEIEIEHQRALQAEETRRQIEEQRLFEEWRRERYGA